MKIVCVMGSPRKDGNSARIAQVFLNESEKIGASTQVFFLNNLVFKGCQACMKCKTGVEKCVVNDGLAPVLEAVMSADILVMASPIYYGQVSGQLKCFIDRTFSFLKPDYMANEKPSRLEPGKKCLFVITQGDPNPEMYANVYTEYASFFKWSGFEMQCLRGLGLMERTDAEQNKQLIEDTINLAKTMVAD
jgi:multimeric flavodoxin WrbA